jgi:hypothetical protein
MQAADAGSMLCVHGHPGANVVSKSPRTAAELDIS